MSSMWEEEDDQMKEGIKKGIVEGLSKRKRFSFRLFRILSPGEDS